jgi:hypothetical protein
MVLTDKPLAVGKRIELEIQVPGHPVTWTALGRVVWARAHADGEDKPAGMGVKLIDVEDDALETIERLVGVSESMPPEADPEKGPEPEKEPEPEVVPSPIVSIPSPVPSQRERTIMGVGVFPSSPPSTPPPPVRSALASPPPPATADHPTPEAFPAAMPREPMRPREPSIAFELLNKERTPSTPPPRPKPEIIDEAPPQKAFAAPRISEPPAPRAAKRGGNAASWWLVGVVLLAAAAAAYWFLGSEPERPAGMATPPVEPSTSTPLVHLPPPSDSVSAAPSAAPPPSAAATAATPPPGAPPPGAAPNGPPVLVPAKRPAVTYPQSPAITIPSPARAGGAPQVWDGGGRALQPPRPGAN